MKKLIQVITAMSFCLVLFSSIAFASVESYSEELPIITRGVVCECGANLVESTKTTVLVDVIIKTGLAQCELFPEMLNRKDLILYHPVYNTWYCENCKYSPREYIGVLSPERKCDHGTWTIWLPK